jgi:hypothetical protein
MSDVVEQVDLQLLLSELQASHGASPEQWADVTWRLENLYWVTDKQGKTARFVLKPQQREFLQRFWHRNLILKARQLGFSTLMQLLQLDQSLFTHNHDGLTIADTQGAAGLLFGKVEFAYDHLHPVMQQAIPILKKNSGSMVVFEHWTKGEDGETLVPEHSRIRIGVTGRGGTLTLLHVSELGRIGRRFPERAEEIKTGALPAAEEGAIVIESTAEGAFGLFFDLCEPAIKRWRDGTPETRKDWRLHFFPWFEESSYAMSDEDTAIVQITPEDHRYFDKLQAQLRSVPKYGRDFTITRPQRAWYVKERETQGRKMKQEYPSTPEEAFEQAVEGAIYGDEMTWLRNAERLVDHIGIDTFYPVHTFWDLGADDATAIWFMQHIGTQFRWFYYFERSLKGLAWWWNDFLEPHRRKHGYRWGKHHLPHDADADMLGENIENKRQILERLGMGRGEGGVIKVVPRVATIDHGIELTRKALKGNHWFAKERPDYDDKGEDMGAGHGIKCLDGYQFEFDEKRQVFSRVPLHNWASHGADAWRQYAQGWDEHDLSNDPHSLKAFKGRVRRSV